MPSSDRVHSKNKSSLYEARIGSQVRVLELKGEPAVCQRLREMGVCEFAHISKISHGEALICRVCDVRIALSKRLAKNILVEAI